MSEVILQVEGMTCMGCVNSVTGVLTGMAGVDAAEVSLEAKQAKVSYDPAVVSPPELAAAVEDAGFDVTL